MGGKSRVASKIATYLESVRAPGQTYIEPFVGAANVIARMSGPRKAYDAHPDLVMLWQALQAGWQPPGRVSEDLHRSLRHAEPSALRAFVGFGCSFGGKFFGGYSRPSKDRPDDYAGAAARGLLRKLATLRDVPFARQSFEQLSPAGALVYCDPPYAGAAGFSVGRFNHDLFWKTARAWSRENTVLVSEASAPADFEPVQEYLAPCGLRNGAGKIPPPRREYLWRLRS